MSSPISSTSAVAPSQMPSTSLKQHSPAVLAQRAAAGDKAQDHIEINGQKIKRNQSRHPENEPLQRLQNEEKRFDQIQRKRKEFLGTNKIELMHKAQKGFHA